MVCGGVWGACLRVLRGDPPAEAAYVADVAEDRRVRPLGTAGNREQLLRRRLIGSRMCEERLRGLNGADLTCSAAGASSTPARCRWRPAGRRA